MLSQGNPPIGIPPADALRLYLAAIAGNEPHSSMIELRWRERPGQPMHSQFLFAQAPKAIIERVAALATRGDVYAGAAPRTRSRGTADAVERTWTLWVDLDTADAVQRLDAFTPRPSIVLLTGTAGHAQALWPLRAPLAREHVKRANRRIAHAVGGDLNATDVARILRVPMTSNHKHSPPITVECVRLDLAVYTPREIVGDLADAPTKAAATSVRPHDDRADPLLTISPTVYVSALLGVEPGRDGKIACPFHDDRSPSLHVYDAPERGWRCYGCERGGSIIDLGAALYSIEPRGRGYHEIRRRLACDLLGSESAA